MGDFAKYKEQLEKRFDADLKDIMVDKYIVKGLGPSISAKQLGIPREAFVFFIEYYKLKEMKYPDFTNRMRI